MTRPARHPPIHRRPALLTGQAARTWWLERLGASRAWALALEGEDIGPRPPLLLAAPRGRAAMFPAVGGVADRLLLAFGEVEEAARMAVMPGRRRTCARALIAVADALEELIREDGHAMAAETRRRMGEND